MPPSKTGHNNNRKEFSVDIFEIDQDTCNRDGICVESCPSGLIVMEQGGYPVPTADAEEVCIRCGHCVSVCPTGSLKHRIVKRERCLPIDKNLKISPEQSAQFLMSRRSGRPFKEKDIPREELAQLLDTARYAPTGHNSQSVEWLVLANRSELRALSGLTVDWMRTIIKDNPRLAAELFLERTVMRWDQGIDVIFRNAPAVIITHAAKDNRIAPMDCVIALTYLDLAAFSMGMSCCWAGYFRSASANYAPLAEALGLPEGHQCFGAMMAGYPKFKHHLIPSRKPPKVTWRF
jgi:nitroreductase/NAD-dependent dihydropyrimidine dehydrogenase PreA subunit